MRKRELRRSRQREMRVPGWRKGRIARKQARPESSGGKSQPGNRYRRISLRAGLAVVAGRAAGALSRRLGLGGGTSIVGLVAQRLYPGIVGDLARELEHGSVVVTGTNGKTTTSGLIATILRGTGLRVWHNREGSNLMGGLASTLVKQALPTGHLREKGQAISIFEVDEAVIPQAVQTITPRVLVLTNLFRDQLDRYGEVDSVAARWREAIANLPTSTILVLNADDPAIAYLGQSFKGRVLYFGIEDATLDANVQNGASERYQAIDTHTCPRCGGEYSYTLRFYSHMGHYTCTTCGLSRPEVDVQAVKVDSEGRLDRRRIEVVSPQGQREVIIPLPGLYNIYNALAAMTAALALEIAWEPIVAGIEQFKAAFGRGERVQMEGRTVRLLLAKNPTGFNEVLRTLFSVGIVRHVLFALNDNVADGRDVSWIWDVDFERAVGQTATLVVTGTRGLDLALRLKYAGVKQGDMTIVTGPPLTTRKAERAGQDMKKIARSRQARLPSLFHKKVQIIEHQTYRETPHRYSIADALSMAVQQTPPGETLYIVPTYTALLEIHRELERRGVATHYWE